MNKQQFLDDVSTRLDEATSLFQSRNLAEAGDILKGLLDDEPECARAWWLMGTILTFKKLMGKRVLAS